MLRNPVPLFDYVFTNADSIDDLCNSVIDDEQHASYKQVRNLFTINAFIAVHLRDKYNTDVFAFFRDAAYILPDGMPIVWLSRLRRTPLYARLTGSDLFSHLMPRLQERSTPVLIVAPSEEVKTAIEARYASVTAIVPDIFREDDQNYINKFSLDCLALITEHNCRYVFIAIGFPKAARLAMSITNIVRQYLPGQDLLICQVGAGVSFHLGLISRAPVWMQRSGLEWLHRLAREPSRLLRRYTVDNIKFLFLATRELFRSA